MAYTKQNFENGKVLTAEQLNRMDAGILEASQTAEALMQAKESGELNGRDGDPGKSAYDYAKEGGYIGTEAQFAAKLAQEYPTKVSELTNDAGYLTGYTESDPTVPAWAKAASKPGYSKSEVGLGNVDNVRQYSANNPPPYPVGSVNGKTGAVQLGASDVGARPADWTPGYADVGADKAGAAASAVGSHNTNESAHNDIRLLISALASRMDALANSDDETLDQMAEVVAYIKSNRGLIEQITTGKVSVSDIVNNLTTNVTNKPLSAAQGVALKALIDAIVIPTKLSQLTNDKGYLTGYTESDPTVPAWAKAESKPTYTAAEVGAVSPDDLEKVKLLIVPILPDDTAPGQFYTPVSYSDIVTALSGERMVCALVNNSLVAPVSSVRNQGVYFSTAYENMLYLFCVNLDNSVSFGIFEAADAAAVTALSTSKLDASALPQAINTALAQAKASGEFDGTSVTVASVSESTADGGTNVVTFSDGKQLNVKNGGKGDPGQRGTGLLPVTTAPSSYTTAVNGLTPAYRISLSTVKSQSKATEVYAGDTLRYSYYHYPVIYVDSSYVYCGTRVSIRGAAGAPGDPGYTPVREVDYWTAADQEAIVQQVIAALGTPVFGRVDENNVVTLTGELADGTYTFKYEDKEGNVTMLGTVTKEPEPTYTNILPMAIDADGSVFNGTGYIDGYRLSSNYNTNAPHYVSTQSGYFTTGYLPYTFADCKNCVPFYVKGVNLDTISDYVRMAMYTDHTATYNNAHTANLNATGAAGFTITKLGEQYYKITPNSGVYNTGGTSSGWPTKNVTVARLSLPGSGAGVILTINEPIE